MARLAVQTDGEEFRREKQKKKEYKNAISEVNPKNDFIFGGKPINHFLMAAFLWPS